MADYKPVLYLLPLSPGCARVRRTARSLGLEVELRDVLLSVKARRELREAAGALRVPTLVHSSTVVHGAREIQKYLTLRYGDD